MDDRTNKSEYSYVNPPTPPAEAPQTPLSWRDAAAPVAALVLALLFWRTFALEYMVDGGYGPGLGVLVFVAAYFGAVFLMLGRRADRGGLVLMAASLALALSCALYAHPGFTVLNCFVILLLSAMATFALSGQGRYGVFRLRAIPESIRLSVLALFTCVDRPFKAAGRAAKDSKGRGGRAILTVLATAALLAVVLALLASADRVFGSFFDGLRQRLAELELGDVLWRIVRVAGLALFVASGLCFLREPAPAEEVRKPVEKELHALPFLPPAFLLDLVYLIFCAVQVRYLFGGAEAASMAGGWAEYARTGFFQLVAVAAINLVFCVLSAAPDRISARGGPALRAANVVLLVLTAVILASALYRMRLYIAAYGMSVLRLMTLWGMLVILAGLLIAAWKLYKPGFAFWPGFFGFVLATWCLFCLANPAGRVADYNVDAYLSGRLAEADVWYLCELGPDAAPALRRLADGAPEYRDEAMERLGVLSDNVRGASWSQWSLSDRKLS